MPEEIFIISILGIVAGTTLTGFIFWNIFSLIRKKIESGNSSSALNPQFFKALGDFKKTTEKRLNNLEAIVSEFEEGRIRIPDSKGEIEIEDEEVRGANKKSDSNLRNMLNE
jgi:hypothetical protein